MNKVAGDIYVHKSNTIEQVNQVWLLISALSKIILGLLVYPIDALMKKGEDLALTGQLRVFYQLIMKELATKKRLSTRKPLNQAL